MSEAQKLPGVSPKAIQYTALVHARSDLSLTATLAQDRFTPGAKVTLRARLTQYESVPLDDASVTAHVRFPDNAVFVLTIENGRITREHRIYDFTGMLIEIGVLKAKPL